MKTFVITTNRNYVEVMKKILSDCQVSGTIAPEIEEYLETSGNRNKIYNCEVSGNKLSITMPMPYRNSFASTMNLEILTNGENTRINGTISSLLSDTGTRRVFIALALIGSFGFLTIQAVRFFTDKLSSFDWIFAGIALIVFLSFLAMLFNTQNDESNISTDDPYGIQMEHWISNLFPSEYKVLKK